MFGFLLWTLLFQTGSFSQDNTKSSTSSQIVFLGTGTPNPDPNHSGPSLAIIVNNTAYLVDFGPGLIRKAAAHSPRYGGSVEALEAKNLKKAFLTHLHTDHTAGYPDLIFTPWVMGRDEPLEVYGPKGITHMTEHILQAYEEDIKIRLNGLEPANDQGWRVNTHEIKEGIIYKDENLEVEAFLVEHGNWEQAFGFIFTTPDRKIAISGDTKPSQNLIDKCKGVDVLIHEVYSDEQLKFRAELWQKYHPQFHTSTTELAEIAKQVKPGLLLLYHQLAWGATEKELVEEITRIYDGRVISANDLDMY
ncbi:MAG: MBL fold metallo-hydrolase [Bacteroidetes bacterium]|nr:MBL fold metallo-hydrolase [Bacteroidota bacterium]